MSADSRSLRRRGRVGTLDTHRGARHSTRNVTGVAEIAEIAPRSLLDGEGSLLQMGRIGARADD